MNTKKIIGFVGAAALVLPTLLLGFGQPNTTYAQPGSDHAFVGTRKCKKCHRKHFKSWEKTAMAKSFSVLAPGEKAKEKTDAKLDPNKDYRKDAKCLECHTVGYGIAGGYADGYDIEKDKKKLLGIGCEMCHGAAGDWLKKGLHDKELKSEAVFQERLPKMKALGYNNEPNKETCTKCHNDKSPFFKEFDFEKAKADKKAMHEHFKSKRK